MPENRKEIKTPVRIGFRDNTLSTVRKLVRRETVRKASEHPPIAMDAALYQPIEIAPSRLPHFPNREQVLVFGAAPVLHFNTWRDDLGTTPRCASNSPRPQELMFGLGFNFLSPVFNYPHPGQDRFTTPFGLPGTSRIEAMGGGSTVFRVASNDDRCCLSNAAKLVTLPAGRMTVWTQGFFLGPDGDRKYYILDVGGKFKLYYEFEAGVTSRLVFIPNSDYSFQVTLDLGFDDLVNWFAPGPRKLVLLWDYSAQLFEIYYNDMRGEGEPIEYIPDPDVDRFSLSLGNSLFDNYENPSAGLEHAYQHFDEWTFARLPDGMFSTSAVDGHVAQSLIPLHDGPHREWGDPCTTPYAMTPINLGSAERPFDRIYVRTLHEACRSARGETHCVNYDIVWAANTEGILARRAWRDETVNPPYLLQPDVPRTIYVTTLPEIPGVTTMTGTVTINGIDADGRTISDVITVNTNIFFIYETNYAFALITSVVVDQTDVTTLSQYAVGFGEKVGLPNYPFNAAGDVFKISVTGGGDLPAALFTINATYGTVDFVGGLVVPITYVFWYRPYMD